MYGGRYAACYFSINNGGRTYSSEEVWGGVRNYLVARKDPWDKTPKKKGHGVGMSQNGATNAANEGVGYREILSFYYPHTTLKTLPEDYRAIVEEAKGAVEGAMNKIKGML